jgi:hypothetical protein
MNMSLTPYFHMPSNSDATIVGKINTTIGERSISRHSGNGIDTFFVEDIDTRNPIAFATIVHLFGHYYQVKNVMTTITNRGIGSSLYRFIITNAACFLISDHMMSPDGKKL